MPLLIHEDRTIFFAHVPKTGGSSVEDYLIRRFGPLCLLDRPAAGSDAPPRRRRHGDMVSPAQHMTAADLRHLLPERIDYTFAVVRDPLARILSEYRFQAGTSRASRLGFSTWLRVMLAAARIDPRVYDNHIRPQGDLVSAGAEVFRLEEGLDRIVARLDEVTGSAAPDADIRHLLNKGGRDRIEVRRQDMGLVARFYAADYARFGYDVPAAGAAPHDRFAALRDLLGWCLARAVVWKQRRDWLR